MFVSIWRLGWPCRRARKADDVVCCKSPFRQLKIKKPAARRSHKTDRKSTRLNSSHGYISYAVFCLKNKKNKKNNQRCDSRNLAGPADISTTTSLGAEHHHSHLVTTILDAYHRASDASMRPARCRTG